METKTAKIVSVQENQRQWEWQGTKFFDHYVKIEGSDQVWTYASKSDKCDKIKAGETIEVQMEIQERNGNKYYKIKPSQNGQSNGYSGGKKADPHELQMAKGYCNENFYFIKPEEDFTLDNILSTVRQLVRKKGITGFVIDAWNKLEHQYSSSETQYISKQLDKLSMFCENNKVHLFLVAHPTKVQKNKDTGNYEVPNLYSISGSANFYNKTANGLTVYRDFDNQLTEIHIQKVKFKHWGQTGLITWRWERENGRYYDGMPDERSWIVTETQLAENTAFLP